MLGELKRLGRETAVYGLSTVVGRALNFLLLPLYTHTLIPAEYGVVATLFSYVAFLNVVYGHGMDFAYMRYFKSKSAEGGWDSTTFSTAFWSLLAVTLTLSLLVQAFARPLAVLGQLGAEHAVLVSYAAWILALDALSLIPFAALRMTHRAALFAGLKTVNIVLNLTLNFVFLTRFHLGMRGVFLASLVTSCATFAMLAPVFMADLSLSFDSELHRLLLRFALPLVPAGLASMVVQVIDRPILGFLTNDTIVGLYQANYRLGIFMMMVVNMFDAAWRPFFLQRAGDRDAGPLFGRILTYWAAGAGTLFLAVSLFVADFAELPLFHHHSLIHPSYWNGIEIVPVVTLGYLFNGFYINFLAPVTIAKRSELVAYATLVGAVVNVATIFWWVPKWGMMGAALATLVAYVGMACSLYLMGRKLYPIPYEWGRLLHAAAALALVCVAARALGVGVNVGRDATRLALLLSFPAGLVLTGFLRPDERTALLRRLGRPSSRAAGI